MPLAEALENNTTRLLEIVRQIHLGCFRLCKEILGRYISVAGNVGVFCQSQEDFEKFTRVRQQLTEPSDNPKQKYFRLKEPIVISSVGDMPATTYTYLYVRQPEADSPQAGDVDFVLDPDEYGKLKQKILSGSKIKGASIFDRPGWDMIELRNPEVNALAYISTGDMAERVRVRF